MPADTTNTKIKKNQLNSSMADEEDEDENEDGGVWFYVNRSGFPLNNFTWDRMYKHVGKLHPGCIEVLRRVQNKKSLPEIAPPQAPIICSPNTLVQERLEMVQKYMSDLQYNHTGTQFFEIRKNRPICGLMDSAKEMIKESLPIKCLEAVILGLYLTLGTPALDRFPISFKTTFSGNTYRHVVLGVYSLGRYGALGMSRRDDLMYKPMVYRSLSGLIKDFKTSYEKYWHTVKKIKIGLPVSHDPHSYEHINWKHQSLNVPKMTWDEMSRELDRLARDMRSQSKKREAILSLYNPPKPRPVTTANISPHPMKKSTHIAKTMIDVKPSKAKKQDRSTIKQSALEERKPKSVVNGVVKPLKPLSSDGQHPTNTVDTCTPTKMNSTYQMRI